MVKINEPTSPATQQGSAVDAYRIHVPDGVLSDLNARLEMTRFPDYFSEGDWEMGIDVPYIRELALMPRAWLERRYNIVHWTEMDRGGHFAAMEQPELFADDVTNFFTALR